jgi:hypothetical protein
MEPIIGFIAFTLTIFSNLPLTAKIFSEEDLTIKIVISFVLGLSTILLPLYIVGYTLTQGFILTSWIIFLLNITILVWESAKHFQEIECYIRNWVKCTFINSGKGIIDYLFFATLIYLFLKYFYILSIKGIYDADAIGIYLPFSRKIYEVDYIPLTAYDYQPILTPMGISVIYAWIHSLALSPYDEAFRLLPILFIVVSLLVVYEFSRIFSDKIAKLSIIIYAYSPVHDKILCYSSYYPDVCYLSLILSTLILIYKYVKCCKTKYILVAGLAYGLSGLMKMQFSFLFPSILFSLSALLSGKKVRIISKYLITGITILIFFLITPIGNKIFILNLELMTKVEIMAFLIVMTTTITFLNEKDNKNSLPKISYSKLMKDSMLFLLFSSIIAGPQFIRNYVLTGSFMWSYQVRIPNYSWAQEQISKITGKSAPLENFSFKESLLLLFSFLLFHSAIGINWLIPKTSGFIYGLKNNKVCLFIIWMIGYTIAYLSARVYIVTLINQRDMWFFVPFFSILSAIGIVKISEAYFNDKRETLEVFLLVVLSAFSFMQSELIISYGPKILQRIFSFIASTSNMSLNRLSLVPYCSEDLHYIPNLFHLALILNVAVFIPILIEKIVSKLLERKYGRIKVRVTVKIRGAMHSSAIKIFLAILLLTSSVTPYIWMSYEFGNGNPGLFGENMLKPLYGGLYADVLPYLNENVRDGDVIIMTWSHYGLQFHLKKNVSFICLALPANLAILRDEIESNDSALLLNKLRSLGVRYILLMKGDTFIMNFPSLCEVVFDPRNFKLISLGCWELYELNEEQVIVGWMDETFTNWTYYGTFEGAANFSFESNGNILNFTVAGEGHPVYRYVFNIPINTGEFRYIACRVKGTSNARWLFRLVSEDGEGKDFPY